MDKFDLKDVANRYNQMNDIWPIEDQWHRKTYESIDRFIIKYLPKGNTENKRILNAGSAGNSYGLDETNVLHLDIARNKLKTCNKKVLANIERIPLRDNSCGKVLCVGSVINYCDPMKAIEEFSRILLNKSFLLLEFECSHSWEFIGKKSFGKKASISSTFYNGSQEMLWVYSENYILDLLRLYSFSIKHLLRIHLLSSLVYLLCRNQHFSSKAIILDKLAKSIPFVRKMSSNIIVLAQKNIV